MRNIYPKLTVPLLFAFAACSTDQPAKSSVSQSSSVPEIEHTAKIAIDSGRKGQNTEVVQRDTIIPPAAQMDSRKVTTIVKTSAGKSGLPDLPRPPHFEDEEINKGIQDFAGMIKENIIAEQNQDSVKIRALKEEINALSTNMAIWIFKMSADERKSFKAYLEKIEKIARDSKQQNL